MKYLLILALLMGCTKGIKKGSDYEKTVLPVDAAKDILKKDQKMTDKIIKIAAAGFYCFMYVWYSRKAIKAVEAILTTQYFSWRKSAP